MVDEAELTLLQLYLEIHSPKAFLPESLMGLTIRWWILFVLVVELIGRQRTALWSLKPIGDIARGSWYKCWMLVRVLSRMACSLVGEFTTCTRPERWQIRSVSNWLKSPSKPIPASGYLDWRISSELDKCSISRVSYGDEGGWYTTHNINYYIRPVISRGSLWGRTLTHTALQVQQVQVLQSMILLMQSRTYRATPPALLLGRGWLIRVYLGIKNVLLSMLAGNQVSVMAAISMLFEVRITFNSSMCCTRDRAFINIIDGGLVSREAGRVG